MFVAFDTATWMLLGLVAFLGVTLSMYALSRYAERERRIIDLRFQVTSLRSQYAQRLAELAARERGEVLEVAPIDQKKAA